MQLDEITKAKLENLDTETYNFLSTFIRNSIHKRAVLEPELLDSIVQDSIIYLCKYYSEDKGAIKTYINYAILRSFQDYNRRKRFWNNKNIQVVNTELINENRETYDNPELPFTVNEGIYFDDNEWKYKLIAELLYAKYTRLNGKNGNRAVYIRNRITWAEIEEMIFWKEKEIRDYINNELKDLQVIPKRKKKTGYVKLSPKAKAESNYHSMMKQRRYWKQRKLKEKEGNKKDTENN